MKIFSSRGRRSAGRDTGTAASAAPAADVGPGPPAVDSDASPRPSTAGSTPAAERAVPPSGDRAFEDLYRRYSVPLLSFCLKQTGGDRQWAEDVVQETLIRAWHHIDRIDPNQSPMPWLATVARRIVIDARRARGARPQEVNPEPLEYVPADDQWEPLLRGMVVAEALQSLSEAHREVLVETVLRDRSVNQAAEVLGIPVGTVKSRVYYAVRALRVLLEERGIAS